MSRRGEWLYLIAAVLAILAVAMRLYRTFVVGQKMDWLELVVPAFFAVALLLMWRGARLRAGNSDAS